MTRLPDDICRCHDATCVERTDCRRWLDRERFADEARGVHTESLRWPPDADGHCGARIPAAARPENGQP